MKSLFALFAAVLLLAAGCATPVQENYCHLETGMTLQQVTHLLGQPKSKSVNGALTTLEYDFARQQPGRTSYYIVVGRDERVRSFGLN